ncbi:MAG: CHRD domain-containing protein [Chloroflexi bacterium]|nr:CHRD domain-containing protein [Chloroflexota bacterium]
MERHRIVRRLRVIAASGLLVGSGGLTIAPGASAQVEWSASLSGSNVVPGPGDAGAVGFASLLFDAGSGEPGSGLICVSWEISDLDPATAAEIGAGAAGDAGVVVVDLPVPDPEGFGGGCVMDLDPDDVQSIIDDPSGHFVNVRNEGFPDGAIRGQVDTHVFLRITVAKAVCPAKIKTPADVLAAPAGTCTVAARTGEIGDPPAGLRWRPAPLEFDMQVSLTHPGGSLSLDDAEAEGGSTCGPRFCSPGRSYSWSDPSLGQTTITELTFPKGYHFGWATIQSTTEGGSAPAASVDIANASISFDTSAFASSEGLSIVLYDFKGGTR